MEPINYTNQFDFSNPAAVNTDPFSNANPTGRPSESVQMADLAAQIPLKPVELPKLSEALVNFSQAPSYESLFSGGIGINLNGGVSLTGRQQGGFRPGDFSTLTDDRMEGTKYNIDQEEVFNNLSTKAWEDWSGFGKVAKFENYIPGTDNEDRLAKQQSGWQMAGRGVEKFLVTASAMVGNTVGMIAYGIPHAIQEKSLKALVDNDVSRFLDDMQTTYTSEDMIYKSAEYRNKSAVGQVFTGTWWADTAAQGLGYLVGGIATGGAAGAAMKAVGFGGAALGGASRVALGNLSKSALAGDFASIAQKGVVKVFKEAIKKDLASQTLKSATGNLVSLITSAAPEAQIESLGFLKEDAEQYLQAFERSYGRPPTAEETLEYREGARQATNGVFASNLALVGTSNFLQFGDLIGADKVFKKGILDGLINKTFGLGIEKSVIEAGKEGLESATWNVLKRTTAQKVGYHTFKALEKPVTEGLWEEGMQSVIQNTASDYMRSKFDPESMNKSKSAISSFIDGFSHTYGSKEGWQEIIAGMVIGGAGSVRVKGGFDILGQREALNATKQYQSQAENLNETQGNFVAANEKLLQAQENYNALQNESIRNLNARVGSTNQQIANSDKARLEAAKGNLEQAQLYYTNSVFAKLAAEKRADLSDSNKFDMDMMIDNIPEQTLKDMYGFKSQEDIDAFKERTKKTLENQREAFDVAWDFAEQLNPGATASNLMSAQNIQEATALQFFHGMMAADNANTIARTIEDTVGQGGIASAMNYYANLDSTNQQRVRQINENTEKVKELELKRNQLLDNMTAALSKAVSEVENTAKVNQVDKINADIENLNNQIQQLTDDTNEINNILSNQVNMPKLPFGNPASKFFSGIGLDLADTDVMGAIDSLKALDNYIKDLENTTGKSKQQQSDDFNKAQVLKSMSGMYQNQMKLMRNFAKVANMVSDPSYGNTLFKSIFRKKETNFNNEDWKKNDKAGYDVQNEGVLNKTYDSLSDEIKKRVDEGKISLFDLHTWETNAQILSMHGRVLQDKDITLDLLNSVISTDEKGNSVYDKESETGKQLIQDVIDTLISGNTLSEPQKIILSLNLEYISKEVDTRKAEKPSEINDLVDPERNITLAKEKRLKKIRDEKLAEAERKLQEKQDELFNNGTLDLSKLRNPETQKGGRKEEIVEAESLEEGDTIHYDGKDRTIKSITKDLFGVKQMTFTDGSKVIIKDPQPGFPVKKVTTTATKSSQVSIQDTSWRTKFIDGLKESRRLRQLFGGGKINQAALNLIESWKTATITPTIIERIVAELYYGVRMGDYSSPTLKSDIDIDSYTGRESDLLKRVSNENGWHYRMPKTGTSAGKTEYRLSLNVKGEPGLIDILDKIASDYGIYYKTPNNSAGWDTRHDPITIYVNKKLTEEQLNELKKRVVEETKPYIRSNDGFGIYGDNISDGVEFGGDVSLQDMQDVLDKAKLIDPILYEGVKQYLTKTDAKTNKTSLKASVGQMIAVNQLISHMQDSLNGNESTTPVNNGINEDITIEELENFINKEYNEEVARIEAAYQEALNPTQPDTEQLISAIDEINEVIEKVIQAANDFNLEISTAVIDSFGDQTIPLKEEIKRINQLLNKEELTSEESNELDTLKAKINDYGLLEGRVVYQGQVGPLRLSDLLEQRNQLEKELFVERKSLNNLNLDEIRNITFEQVVETEPEFKEGKSGGDAGVLNSYEFTTFKKVGDNFQIANLKPQGFIEEIGIGNTDVEVTINSQGDVFTIPEGETDYDSQIQPGDKVSVSFTNPEGVSVNISFEVDSSRRINIPISNAEVLNDHTVLSFNTANTIGSSGYYTLTKFDGDNEVYTSSDFDVELDSEATQRLNPGDQISFMYDTEGDDFNKRLEDEYRAALPDPDIQYIIDSVEEYLNDVAGKTKQEREDIYREVSALLGTKVTTKPDALKIVRKLKADNKPVSQEVLDEISMRMKNNMRIVAVDKSGNRVGIVKSIGNSNSAGNGRNKNNHLRTALFEQLKENNFNPKTKSKFSVPVKIVYMGIPNVKSVNGDKVQFNFSEEPGENNINPSKIKSVGYVTYGDMKLQGNKKISTPYNYAKNIMENTLYQGKKIPVVVFDYNGKEVVYPITLIENDGPTLSEQFQDILNQRQSLTLSEFITKANDFLAENGVERNIRLTSLNLNQKLDNVIANLENVPNIPSISEIMGTSNFREVLKEKAMIDINLNDKPFIGPKIRFDINAIPETQLNDVSEEVKPTAPQAQSIEEITDNECFD